jgi:hypothetical protein
MKSPRLTLTVFLLFGLGTIVPALRADAPRGKKLYAMVVSERTDVGPKDKAPDTVEPFSYVAVDGGYIESGDPVAGEKPPTSAQVAEAFRDGLAAAHHTVGTTSDPALVLVYNWGVIRKDSFQIAPNNDVTPNHRARLNLVAPSRTVDRVASDVVNRRYRMPSYMTIEERDALTYAQDDRYFVVVAAYDYAALLRGESVLRWRTRLSAATNSGSMDVVIPALIRNGAGFLGRHLNYMQTEIWRIGMPEAQSTSDTAASAQSLISALNQETLREIVFNEHVMASGENATRARQKNATIAPSRATLPPELSARIAAYQKQKSSLQEALSSRIKGQQPGTETQRAIEAFNAEHASEIAELNRSRDGIRDDLARLSAQNGGSDKSLEALQREFATSVQNLGAAPARP